MYSILCLSKHILSLNLLKELLCCKVQPEPLVGIHNIPMVFYLASTITIPSHALDDLEGFCSNCKEGRMPKNWCLWNMVLEKTRKSPLNSKEIKPVNLKWDQPWIFTWRVDAEAPIFWSSDANRWLTGKVPDAGKTEYRWKGGCQRVKWLDGITDAMNINSGELWKMMRDREAWVAEVHRVGHTTEGPNNK